MRLLSLAFVLGGAVSACGDEARVPKVLILGIDGCRADALAAAEAPRLKRLIAEGAISRNNDVIGDRAPAADTVSGPGWSSILTGVWADKHGVLNNDFRNPNLKQYPNVLRLLKQARPESGAAAFVTWKPLADFVMSTEDGCRLILDGDKQNYVDGDRLVAQAALELLNEGDPDLLFVYLGQVDVAGHQHGFHPEVPEYMQAIATVDGHVGQVLDALAARRTSSKEDWLTLVCTDHGGRGTGHGGGRGAPEVRKTFLIVHGPPVVRGEIAQPTANVDLVPTALAHLGVPLRSEWSLDGQAIGLKRRGD
jgi:predicted AlkP superfamily pyrophosphatase or phosphodiesterase